MLIHPSSNATTPFHDDFLSLIAASKPAPAIEPKPSKEDTSTLSKAPAYVGPWAHNSYRAYPPISPVIGLPLAVRQGTPENFLVIKLRLEGGLQWTDKGLDVPKNSPPILGSTSPLGNLAQRSVHDMVLLLDRNEAERLGIKFLPSIDIPLEHIDAAPKQLIDYWQTGQVDPPFTFQASEKVVIPFSALFKPQPAHLELIKEAEKVYASTHVDRHTVEALAKKHGVDMSKPTNHHAHLNALNEALDALRTLPVDVQRKLVALLGEHEKLPSAPPDIALDHVPAPFMKGQIASGLKVLNVGGIALSACAIYEAGRENGVGGAVAETGKQASAAGSAATFGYAGIALGGLFLGPPGMLAGGILGSLVGGLVGYHNARGLDDLIEKIF